MKEIDEEKLLKDLKEDAEAHAQNTRERNLLYRAREIVRANIRKNNKLSMNEERAIYFLELISPNLENTTMITNETFEALEIAIEALKKQKERKDYIKEYDEYLKRNYKAGMKAIEAWDKIKCKIYNKMDPTKSDDFNYGLKEALKIIEEGTKWGNMNE